jgi:hypothetical protein
LSKEIKVSLSLILISVWKWTAAPSIILCVNLTGFGVPDVADVKMMAHVESVEGLSNWIDWSLPTSETC